VPTVGWPTKGISVLVVKNSIVGSFGSLVSVADVGKWRKTTSKRLNSAAMSCFRDWVMVVLSEAEISIIARGLPVCGVEEKTSRVVKESFIMIMSLCYIEVQEY